MTEQTPRSVTVVDAVVHRPTGRYRPEPQGVVVEDGVIAFVGDSHEAQRRTAPDAPVVDARGRYLMPGLIETHGHPGLYARLALNADCRPSVTPRASDVVEVIRGAARETGAGEWVIGWGYDEHRMDGGGPTRADLDEAAPDHPVYLKRTCAHMALVNTAALRRMGITGETPDPPGGCIVRDEGGEPTGLLQETAMSLADLPVSGPRELLDGMRVAQEDFSAWGLTTVHDMSTGPLEMGAYLRLQEAGQLHTRFRPWYFALKLGDFHGSYDEVIGTGIRSGLGDDMVRIQGMKFILDGSVGGRTAAVAEPFEGSDSRGILYYDTPRILPMAAQALRNGLRLAIHGIGERAVEQALDLVEGAGREVASESEDPQAAFRELVSTRRHRVEHCALPTDEDLRRLVDSGVIAASSTAFVHELGDSYLKNLGQERMNRAYPMRTFLDRGIVAPSNSDFPVTTANPWFGISACVTRTSVSGQVTDTAQNITVAEALDAYTVEAAKASFDEDRLGRIAEGFLGDLVLLDRHPFEVDARELKDVSAELTVCDGRIVHRTDAA
ncbi:amidohydrolase [Kocuria tytonis]|uniref:Amidohydrolase n=1 Tax=Kocuria tytonis TaxID=2054280 RepID=A0A495A616_9MICC|nr:amidohydrolase [Kocuria tytonis]RKQ35283.1 amidohydrolase [Kocuria tytonis]